MRTSRVNRTSSHRRDLAVRAWDGHSRLVSLTDPLGRTTRHDYDHAGRLTRTTGPDGTTAVYTYDEHTGLPVSARGPDGAEWRYDYDERGKVLAATDPLGAVTAYTYDERGAVASVTDPLGTSTSIAANPAGIPLEVATPAGVTRFTVDALGRTTEVTEPGAGTTRLRWTREGLPLSRTAPDGSVEYDAELRPVRVAFPGGLNWTYAYDAEGNLVAETDLNGRALAYRYDEAGELAERVNGAGQTIRYVRDALGRVVEQRTDDGVTTFAYDPAGGLTKAVNADAELAFDLDPLGRVLSETCNGRTLSSRYDLAGRRVRRRTPSGHTSVWTYDATHHPVGLLAAGRTVTFGYDRSGRETQRQVGPMVTLGQSWDELHRLTGQRLSSGPGNTVGRSLRRYDYRTDGLVVAVEDAALGRRTYEHDAAGRITAVHDEQRVERYAYDPVGNLVYAETGDQRNRDMQGPRGFQGTLIESAGRSRYEHDAQGRVVRHTRRLLSGGARVWTYAWDAEDRLREMVTPDGKRWRYRYDPLGRRIAKQLIASDGMTVLEQTDFVWDGTRLAEQSVTRPGTTAAHTTWDWEPGADRPVTQVHRTVADEDPESVDETFYAIVTDLVGGHRRHR